MSMKIAHNIPALNANKNLYTTNQAMNKSLQKLSSGFRINSGEDGPADLVISERLRSQIGGLERAVRNTSEANNVLSIAEGALNEMNSILKKMKALAIHAANNGVTSPDQVASDQSELDSAVQTLDRIASTTKFSDQHLLNGAKDLSYNVNTNVVGTQNNQLLNTELSSFNQIFKREGYQVTISFNGAVNPDAATNMGNAAMSRQAAKAYLEIDAYAGTKSQINEDAMLTQGQNFILTGSLGSRQFTFSKDTHISEIVSAIHNSVGSTGIDASLIFNRTQTIHQSTGSGQACGVGLKQGNTASNLTIYDNLTYNNNGQLVNIANTASVTGVEYGKNTDGQGYVYVKLTGDGAGAAYELYKDASLSKESLIGTGVGDGANASVARNNSGLTMTIGIQNGKYGDVFKVSTGNVILDSNNANFAGAGRTTFNADASTAAGVQLGVNTASDGTVYLKTVYDNTGCFATVYAYNNALMREQDMVAKTYDKVDMSKGTQHSIILDSLWNEEKTASTGLGLTLALGAATDASGTGKANASETATIRFSNLGARIYATEYGNDHFIKVQQFEGGLFTDYENQASYDSARLIEAGESYTKRGQDATVNVNGQQMKTQGLTLNLATNDIRANLTFNSGKTGSTTIAQVGYGEGSIYTKATSLTFDFNNVGGDQGSNATANALYSAKLNNANHNTKETVGDFDGGMQLQLGEGSGDQERTVISLKSMSTAQLGRIQVTKQFDPTSAVVETKTLSIQDVMGGQVASLGRDPELAMRIIDRAITDVSELRAQIGATQANMLQTNENNLRVAIENLTKTESDIRDTDMASEMTEFTKNQIMANAGVSMLSQANSNSQMVLALLGG